MELLVDALDVPPPTHALANESTITAIAKAQVAFSRKSVVLRTPNIWLEAPNEEVNPPPLESWISTTRISNIHAAIIKMSNKISPIVL